MSKVALPTFNITFTTTLKGASLLPGDLISLTREVNRLYSERVIVTRRKIDNSTNRVVISGYQYRTPQELEAYDISPAVEVDYDFSPNNPDNARIIEAPYWFARQKFGAYYSYVNNPTMLGTPQPRFAIPLGISGGANTNQASFSLELADYPTIHTDVVQNARYSTKAKLTSDISRFDAFSDGIIASVAIEDVVSKDMFADDIGDDGVKEGKRFVFINDEILSYESVTVTGTTATLENVHRGSVS